jgi:hypothetical protein
MAKKERRCVLSWKPEARSRTGINEEQIYTLHLKKGQNLLISPFH